jgi:4-amino-4-deoxy-L-arabinose transferase-like glycosyltransferase
MQILGIIKNKRDLSHNLVFLLINLTIAFIILFRTAYNASNLQIIPESVEYAVASSRLVTDQSYTIIIDGQSWPPRYPPWFSMLVIAPAYLLFGDEPGNAIFPILLAGMLSVVAAFVIGYQVKGPICGVSAGLALLAPTLYRYMARQVMTDIPCVALILLACLLYMRLRTVRFHSRILYLSAGILSGLCAAFRPVCASVILPFLWFIVRNTPKRHVFQKIALVAISGIFFAALTMLYNNAVFGTPMRTGYHFWCPVPYDQPGMTFSLSYVSDNFKTMIQSGLPVLVLAILLLILLDKLRHEKLIVGSVKKPMEGILEFTIITCIPMVIFHLLYFFSTQRFFLPIISLLAVIFGIMVGLGLHHVSHRALAFTQLIILVGVLMLRFVYPDPPPMRRIAADHINRYTPGNALVISAIDPAYLEFMTCKSSQRRILPISRRVEYASKLVARQKTIALNPKPTGWWDHRSEGLAKANAEEVVPHVADGEEDRLYLALSNGVPIFIDKSHLTDDDMQVVRSIRQRFSLIRCTNYLFRIDWKESKSSESFNSQ